MDDYHCLTVWDWRKGKQIASTRGHGDKVSVCVCVCVCIYPITDSLSLYDVHVYM